jgi:hypothetical protein
VFVEVAVALGTGVPVLVLVGPVVLVDVFVAGPAVFVRVGVNVKIVGVGPVPADTFDEKPGNPHRMFEAPMMAPFAFSDSTTPQISPPLPGNVTGAPVDPCTPSVPTPHTM